MNFDTLINFLYLLFNCCSSTYVIALEFSFSKADATICLKVKLENSVRRIDISTHSNRKQYLICKPNNRFELSGACNMYTVAFWQFGYGTKGIDAEDINLFL